MSFQGKSAPHKIPFISKLKHKCIILCALMTVLCQTSGSLTANMVQSSIPLQASTLQSTSDNPNTSLSTNSDLSSFGQSIIQSKSYLQGTLSSTTLRDTALSSSTTSNIPSTILYSSQAGSTLQSNQPPSTLQGNQPASVVYSHQHSITLQNIQPSSILQNLPTSSIMNSNVALSTMRINQIPSSTQHNLQSTSSQLSTLQNIQASSVKHNDSPSPTVRSNQPSSITSNNEESTTLRNNQPSSTLQDIQTSPIVHTNQASSALYANQPSSITQSNQEPITLQSTQSFHSTLQDIQTSSFVQGNQPSSTLRSNQPPTITQSHQESTILQGNQQSFTLQGTQTSSIIQSNQPWSTLWSNQPPAIVQSNHQTLTKLSSQVFPSQQSSHSSLILQSNQQNSNPSLSTPQSNKYLSILNSNISPPVTELIQPSSTLYSSHLLSITQSIQHSPTLQITQPLSETQSSNSYSVPQNIQELSLTQSKGQLSINQMSSTIMKQESLSSINQPFPSSSSDPPSSAMPDDQVSHETTNSQSSTSQLFSLSNVARSNTSELVYQTLVADEQSTQYIVTNSSSLFHSTAYTFDEDTTTNWMQSQNTLPTHQLSTASSPVESHSSPQTPHALESSFLISSSVPLVETPTLIPMPLDTVSSMYETLPSVINFPSSPDKLQSTAETKVTTIYSDLKGQSIDGIQSDMQSTIVESMYYETDLSTMAKSLAGIHSFPVSSDSIIASESFEKNTNTIDFSSLNSMFSTNSTVINSIDVLSTMLANSDSLGISLYNSTGTFPVTSIQDPLPILSTAFADSIVESSSSSDYSQIALSSSQPQLSAQSSTMKLSISVNESSLQPDTAADSQFRVYETLTMNSLDVQSVTLDSSYNEMRTAKIETSTQFFSSYQFSTLYYPINRTEPRLDGKYTSMKFILDGDCAIIRRNQSNIISLKNKLRSVLKQILNVSIEQDSINFADLKCKPFSIIIRIPFKIPGLFHINESKLSSLQNHSFNITLVEKNTTIVIKIIDINKLKPGIESESGLNILVNSVVISLAACICGILITLFVAIFIREVFWKNKFIDWKLKLTRCRDTRTESVSLTGLPRSSSVHSEMKDNGSLASHTNPSFGVYSTVENETSFMKSSDLRRSSGRLGRLRNSLKNKIKSSKRITQNGQANKYGTQHGTIQGNHPYGLVIGLMGYRRKTEDNIYAVPKKHQKKCRVYGLAIRPTSTVLGLSKDKVVNMTQPHNLPVPPRRHHKRFLKHGEVRDSSENLVTVQQVDKCKPGGDDLGVDNPAFGVYDSKSSLHI